MLYPAELRGPRRGRYTAWRGDATAARAGVYRIVGITYSAPERMPAGQRDVTVLSLV
jgi:hypothetical protein